MTTNAFSWGGFWLRLVFAFVLVAVTYNPLGYSFYHLVLGQPESIAMSVLALVGVLLLIGWVIFLRATLRSLGVIGLGLALGLFGTLIWMLFDFQVLSLDEPGVLNWVAIVVISLVLAIGMSWSHVRRRMSGQIDADDVDED